MIHVELDGSCEKNRICVRFPYSRQNVELIRGIPGRSYLKKGKHWHLPLDLETCRTLRATFKTDLTIGPELWSWAQGAVKQERTLGSIAVASTATLERLPVVMPELYKAIHLGPLGKHMTEAERVAALDGPASYQAADVAFLVQAPAPLNGNEQGTGKTIEWIATIWEAGLEEGDHLIVCPKAAIDGTWEGELAQWQSERDDVEVFACVDDRDSRQATLEAWQRSEARVRWLIVNPAMIMYQKQDRSDHLDYIAQWTKWVRDKHGRPPTQEERDKIVAKAHELFPLQPLVLAVKGKKKEKTACYCGAILGAHEHYTRPFPEITQVYWKSICIDEAHKGVVRNHRSLTAKSFKDLKLVKAGKPCLMSGTPMKKRGGADLWGMLNFLNPKVFSSYWRFVDSYYNVTDNGYGKKVGTLRVDREDALFRALTPYVLRRTKKEVAPWLPDKHYVDVPVQMSKPQERQYRAMENNAIAMIGNDEVFATGVLSQITRLKQFANAHCRIDKETGEIHPLASPKVDAMVEKMEEIGMFEEGATHKQLVFSQSRRMVNFIADRLRAEGLSVDIISGKIKNSAERKRIKEEFQNGSTRVLVIVTTAGGVSLTLDAADEVHMIDEMWSPDEDAQAEDRAHRVSRIHQVTVYTYRSIGTVDEDISMAKIDKAESHELILDIRRNLLKRAGVLVDA